MHLPEDSDTPIRCRSRLIENIPRGLLEVHMRRIARPERAETPIMIEHRADNRAAHGGQARDAAEALAISALEFLAADRERLAHFLAMSGIDPGSIRDAAREPRFLVGVLDHVAGDEPLLLLLAAANRIEPGTVMRARDTLAGDRREKEAP